MMKWGFTINAGLGAVLVVSAMGAGSNGEQGLELTLTRTVHGLEELAGIRARLESGDAAAVSDLIRATDAPSANPAAEEARLASLRLEVARLQMIHDGLAPLDAKPEMSKKGRDAVQDAASKRGDAHGSRWREFRWPCARVVRSWVWVSRSPWSVRQPRRCRPAARSLPAEPPPARVAASISTA